MKELTESDRLSILRSFFSDEADLSATLQQVASCTHGFSYSQMLRLCRTMQRRATGKENDAWIQSVNEIYNGGKDISAALSLSEGDKDQWESVGGYESVKKVSAPMRESQALPIVYHDGAIICRSMLMIVSLILFTRKYLKPLNGLSNINLP